MGVGDGVGVIAGVWVGVTVGVGEGEGEGVGEGEGEGYMQALTIAPHSKLIQDQSTQTSPSSMQWLSH